MKRKDWIILPIAALLTATLGCNLPGTGNQTEAALVGTATTSLPSAGSQAEPTLTDTPATATPQSTEPKIASVAFTSDPQSGSSGSTFPKGIGEIWAVMDYSNMRAGLTIRRVWYKDGTPWIEREEVWDFAKYGAQGQIEDISIYDREVGLPAGHYEFEVFIDGQNQFLSTGEARAYFDIIEGPTGTETFTSPDGKKIAYLDRPGSLRVDGTMLAHHAEIETVQWFADSQHLLYVVVDRSEQMNPPATIGLKWELWIVDSAGGQPSQISEGSEQLHNPIISPQGDVIAAGAGSGYCDAGLCDYILKFIRLTDFQRSALLSYQEFAGMPEDSGGAVVPLMNQAKWSNTLEFDVPLNGSFQAVGFNPGLYRFDLSTLIAKRIGDLP